MKKLLFALAFCFLPSLAWAQCTGVFAPNTICGNSSLTQPNVPSAQTPNAFQPPVVVVTPNPATTADVTINAAIGTLAGVGGTVDARAYGCTSPIISNTLSVNTGGGANPVTLILDRCTIFTVGISNSTAGVLLGTNASVIAYGIAPQGFGYDTFHLTSTASVSSVLQNDDQVNGFGIKLAGFSMGASAGAKVGQAAVYLNGVHGTNILEDLLIESIPSCGIKLTQNNGITLGTVTLFHNWIDAGTVAGSIPLCMNGVATGGIVGVNVIGGAYEHPASGNPIVNLSAVPGGTISDVNFYGIYSETSFASNHALVINGATNILVDGWANANVTATNCIQLTNAGGGSVQSVSLRNIPGGACGTTVQDSINSLGLNGDINDYEFGNTSGQPFIGTYVNGGNIWQQASGGTTLQTTTINTATLNGPNSLTGATTVTSAAVTSLSTGPIFPKSQYNSTTIPACNAGRNGFQIFTTDASPSSYHAIYSGVAGGGGLWVFCDGTNWRNN